MMPESTANIKAEFASFKDSNAFKVLAEALAKSESDYEFNIFEALGIKDRELSHSALLEYLLNPSHPHGFNDKFLKLFINQVFKSKLITENRKMPYGVDEINSYEDVVTRLEDDRIDITISFPKDRVIVGIENKIWAGEQEDQIKRYQDSLKSRVEFDHRILVFLTPNGRMPQTGICNHDTPCAVMSWDDIASIIGEIYTNNRSNISIFLEQTRHHILEDIVKPDKLIRKNVLELYRDHWKVIREIFSYAPYIAEYEYEYEIGQNIEKIIKEKDLFPDAHFEPCKHSNSKREISFCFYNDKLPPITIYLYNNPKTENRDWPFAPYGVLAIHDNDYNANQDKYNELQKLDPDLLSMGNEPFSKWSNLRKVYKRSQELDIQLDYGILTGDWDQSKRIIRNELKDLAECYRKL